MRDGLKDEKKRCVAPTALEAYWVLGSPPFRAGLTCVAPLALADKDDSSSRRLRIGTTVRYSRMRHDGLAGTRG